MNFRSREFFRKPALNIGNICLADAVTKPDNEPVIH